MRRGFTLIEMLVATALVVLIMILFAEIFQEAIGTVRAQRGLIANDEKARVYTQTLRTDLNRATYRSSVGRGATLTSQGLLESPRGIVALGPGDRPDPRQQGFVYISENDPDDDGDDILHLTVSIGESLRDPLISNPSFAPYQGRAANQAGGSLNQPDADDGILGDSAATSRAAEVCYFLRGTTLYRRVMLIRDPLPSASPPFGTQPTNTATGAPLMANYANFYHDFDYSATRINTRLHFHGLESLDNARGATNAPLALPQFRFGHRTSGEPREFDDDATFPRYFGRFTQQETADPAVQYPGQAAAINPADLSTLSFDSSLGYLTDTAGPTPLNNAANIHDWDGVDIFMTNVEAFDIEIWDPGYAEADYDGVGGWVANDPDDDLNRNGVQDAGIWVDLGNGTQTGLYCEDWTQASTNNKPGNETWGRRNGAYGPGGPAGNHVFDTWHPSIAGVPPVQPLQVDPGGGAPVIANWAAATGAVGEILFPDLAALTNASIGYVVVDAGTPGAREPEWPREPGALVQDGGVTWKCFDNRVGLEKIRITIRFRDPGTGQARQVSLVHAFTE